MNPFAFGAAIALAVAAVLSLILAARVGWYARHRATPVMFDPGITLPIEWETLIRHKIRDEQRLFRKAAACK